ncbi:unnamed protein product [Menidia menidia]|uniref:(Atlantic silverside) hypothetical protein n=1 Tax=Menidia menidia TaxID=238744 RepID=A0A8S4AA22_9TELE|nr:unnamed protein product [Menidia menidia]
MSFSCPPQVYITCSVILCDPESPFSRCAQGCLKDPSCRRRRELSLETGGHSITQGPLQFVGLDAPRVAQEEQQEEQRVAVGQKEEEEEERVPPNAGLFRMASSIHLLLLLLLVASSEAQSYKHVAASLAFRPKGKSPDGKYQVELRYRPTGVDYHQNSFVCLWTNCGSNLVKYSRTVAHDSYNLTWHSYEVLAVLQLSSDFLFEMRLPDYYNYHYGAGYWVPRPEGTSKWVMRTSLDLGTRSDTGESNRPPITSTVPIIRLFILLNFGSFIPPCAETKLRTGI